MSIPMNQPAKRLRAVAAFALFSLSIVCCGQLSKVWTPDAGEGTYRNPVLYADYSDPDVTRVGRDFYMVASSFDAVPGLPILHSTDLVHWELIAHGFKSQVPLSIYSSPQHGNGAWAPSIRYHGGQFFIFYPDPDFGIYMIKSKSITGPWTEPLLIKAAKGWIDPCPLWDDDGKAYLINALAGSRAGVKGALVLSRMAPDGNRVLDEGSLIIDGHDRDPTLEGPKIYKRHGYYYVFAPAGGVPTGWQLVYRSRSIYGPYQRRVVLAQGSTAINGPHQGAWVNTAEGEDWFLHFQDQGPYGRVVDLEPMRWGPDDWPLIGVHQDAAGTGEPVVSYRKPKTGGRPARFTPADSDEFNAPVLGMQWQWQANPQPNWSFPAPAIGVLRMIAVPSASNEFNLYKLPNVLLQKFPAPEFTVTAKVTFTSRTPGEQTGLVVMGRSYSSLVLESTPTGVTLRQSGRQHADTKSESVDSQAIALPSTTVYLRASVVKGGSVRFSYSTDGSRFDSIGAVFQATPGVWIGAKVGLFAISPSLQGEHGYADFDWFRFER